MLQYAEPPCQVSHGFRKYGLSFPTQRERNPKSFKYEFDAAKAETKEVKKPVKVDVTLPGQKNSAMFPYRNCATGSYLLWLELTSRSNGSLVLVQLDRSLNVHLITILGYLGTSTYSRRRDSVHNLDMDSHFWLQISIY